LPSVQAGSAPISLFTANFAKRFEYRNNSGTSKVDNIISGIKMICDRSLIKILHGFLNKSNHCLTPELRYVQVVSVQCVNAHTDPNLVPFVAWDDSHWFPYVIYRAEL
jgi:hypothetical protein